MYIHRYITLATAVLWLTTTDNYMGLYALHGITWDYMGNMGLNGTTWDYLDYMTYMVYKIY